MAARQSIDIKQDLNEYTARVSFSTDMCLWKKAANHPLFLPPLLSIHVAPHRQEPRRLRSTSAFTETCTAVHVSRVQVPVQNVTKRTKYMLLMFEMQRERGRERDREKEKEREKKRQTERKIERLKEKDREKPTVMGKVAIHRNWLEFICKVRVMMQVKTARQSKEENIYRVVTKVLTDAQVYFLFLFYLFHVFHHPLKISHNEMAVFSETNG